MVSRISTFVNNTTIFNDINRLQTNFSDVQTQAASGLKAQTFDGIALDTQRLLSLETQSNSINANITAINTTLSRTSLLQDTLSSISNVLDRANSLLTQALSGINGNTTSASTTALATGLRDEIVSELNSRSAGRYIFGGSVQNVPPVNLSAPGYNPTATPGTPSTQYYQGDSVIESVRASDSLRISFGITADNSAFEQALRGLEIVIANPTNTTSLTQAFDLIKQASQEVGDLRGALTGQVTTLTQTVNFHGATLDYLKQSISDLRDVDVAQASAQGAQLETQLQASFGSLAKLLQLRLSDYLR